MQSKRDSDPGASRRRSSSIIDFGEGEPYLDGEEDVAYLKRFQQVNSSGTGVRKVSKLEVERIEKYNNPKKSLRAGDKMSERNANNCEITEKDQENKVHKSEFSYGKQARSEYSFGVNGKNTQKISPKKEDMEKADDNSKEDSHIDDEEKDSLEEEDSSSNEDDDNSSLNLEGQYDVANPPNSQNISNRPTSPIDQSKSSEGKEIAKSASKKSGRNQLVNERLSRDAMSLKRHQIRDEVTHDLDGGEEGGGRDKSRKRSKSRHRDESRKRVGDTRKSFKAAHDIYGDDYPTPKYHLPPRSPTFSFRSTIDLLPSSRRKQGLRQQIIVTLSCCLGPLSCGFAFGYIHAINPADIVGVNPGVWRTYAYFIGCICGAFFSGLLVNIGRKRTLLLTMAPYALSWLAVIFAKELWMLLVFHATAGMCTGLVMALAQVYVAEIATPGIRGAISTAPLITFNAGALLCYSLVDTLIWRQLAAAGMGITLPFFIAVVLCMPESPRFLVHVSPNDALATLQWLRGVDSDVMDEYRDIADNSDTDRWSLDFDDLTRPTFWRPLLISCGLMFLYNMTGLASFGLYGMELFSEVSHHSLNVAYYINSVIVIIGIIIASLLVDQLGRKLLLLLSITIMAASAFTIGLFMFLKDYNKVDSYFEYQWAAEVFCVVLFTFAHGSGMSPIAWISMGEVFGPRNKWVGVTLSSMVFWSSMIAVDVIFHQLRNAVLTGGIFWFHCVMCVGGYIFVLLCFRELKEQRIDDITKSFTKKHDNLIDTFITRA